jgi:hypothetical protein
LDLLTDWVSNPNSETYDARIFNVVAMGGMGKSAVTWKWFNDIAPHKMRGLAGRLWWSFYETDSHFDNWIIRALAYVSCSRLFSEERRLDAALTELEDRGLLGWDRRANRYDVHPIVRGILWGRLEDSSRIRIFGELEKHFQAARIQPSFGFLLRRFKRGR